MRRQDSQEQDAQLTQSPQGHEVRTRNAPTKRVNNDLNTDGTGERTLAKVKLTLAELFFTQASLIVLASGLGPQKYVY